MEKGNGEILIRTTEADPEHAELFARGLVERKLAACVTCLPNATSFYHWEEQQITRDVEIVLLIKTHHNQLAQVEQYFEAEHPYELPECLVLEVSALSAGYRNWMLHELYASPPAPKA